VEKMRNYTRNEWRRCKTTLETSVVVRVNDAEDVPVADDKARGKGKGNNKKNE
jgi:hypothetical protein